MSMIAMWFKKSLIVAMIAAMGLSALPFVNAYAQSPNPPVTPAPGQPSSDKLQKAWAREQTIYTRIGKIFNRANSMVSKIQTKLNDAQSQRQGCIFRSNRAGCFFRRHQKCAGNLRGPCKRLSNLMQALTPPAM